MEETVLVKENVNYPLRNNPSLQLPLVSINIPTYNQEKYIARAISSALAQDYPNLEVVVSDDCSTDNTFAIAKSLESDKVRVHQNQKNLGRVGNYRFVLYNLSRGEWVVNLDGDDYYDDPTFISEAIHHLQSDPGIVMYASGAKAMNEKTGRIEKTPMQLAEDRCCMSGVDYVLRYPQMEATQHFAVVYNRRLALQTDFYSLDSLGADTDSLCRLALKGKVFVQKKYAGVWTCHDSNASYSLTIEDTAKELSMFKHIAAALKGHVPQPVADEWLRERLEMKNRFALVLNLSKLPPADAFQLYKKHFRLNAFFFREGVKLTLRFLRLKQ